MSFTTSIGKWHLGEQRAVLPLAQGFDYYYGMPGPNHNESKVTQGNQAHSENRTFKGH